MNNRLLQRAAGYVLVGVIAGGAVPGVVSSTSEAQAVETAPKPPTTRDSDQSPNVLNFILLALLAGGVVGASVFPAKRGHQD